MKNAVHFVGFRKDNPEHMERWNRAIKLTSNPDFIHYIWDNRAKAEVIPGDTVIFADPNASIEDKPNRYSYDDSANR